MSAPASCCTSLIQLAEHLDLFPFPAADANEPPPDAKEMKSLLPRFNVLQQYCLQTLVTHAFQQLKLSEKIEQDICRQINEPISNRLLSIAAVPELKLLLALLLTADRKLCPVLAALLHANAPADTRSLRMRILTIPHCSLLASFNLFEVVAAVDAEAARPWRSMWLAHLDRFSPRTV